MALKVEENPPELLAPLDQYAPPRYEWNAVVTKSRHEKRLAFHLSRQRIPYFLPMVARRTVSRNLVLSPLFPGFVFVAMEKGTDFWDVVRESHCVASIWPTRDQVRIFQELNLLASENVHNRTLVVAQERDLRIGDTVRVTEGPFAGMTGKVTVRSGVTRLTVQLQLMGTVASMDIDPRKLESV